MHGLFLFFATFVVALGVTMPWRHARRRGFNLLSDTLGVLDVMGEGLETVGAAIPANIAATPMGGVLQRMVQTNPWQAAWLQNVNPAGAQAAHSPREDLDPLPFREQNNNGVVDATHTQLVFLARPQRPWRGERLLVSAFTTITGLDPFAPLVITLPFFVGMATVGAAQGNFPLGSFQRDGFGVRLSMPSAGQGTDIVIEIASLLTPTGTDTITVTIGAIGRAVR
jgi:hypothetical protein